MKYTVHMSEDIIANLILALQQHTALALSFVFLVAFSESLIIVGLIVPGAILMVLFGALISMDALEFWPTVIFATTGAIAGDGLSYWLGRRYKTKLHNIWPLSRHPEAITSANQFFDKHGVKSIILSRFIGLLRPIIPAIAGMAKMPFKIFLAANIGSSIIWAPLYLLPGILFGLSIEMANEFASKFVFLIVALLFIILISLWAIQRLYIFVKPHNDRAITNLLNWGKKHSLAGEVPASIFDANHPELRGLSLVAIIIFTVTSILSLLQNAVIFPYDLFIFNFDSINQLIYHSLQHYRSPPLDSIMLWLSYLASSKFIALLCFSLGSLFLIKKDFLSLWHWLAAIALPLLLSPLLSDDLTYSLQQDLNINLDALSFIVNVSAIGFLTIIINSGLPFPRQNLIYYVSATLVLLLMLAQLYFATQVFSQILFGLFVGLIWFSLLGIAYRRHITDTTDNITRREILIIISVLLIYPGWKTMQTEEIHQPSEKYFIMGTHAWLDSGWELLPLYRHGIYKSNLFNLQWAGIKKNISSRLSELGYTNGQNTTRALSNWFLDGIEINKLPVLPHIHNGQYEKLRFYRYSKKNKALTVIRLWQSKYKLKQNNPLQPLWFGSISYMEIKEKLGITYLVTKNEKINEIKFDEKNEIAYKQISLNIKDNKLFLIQ